MTPIVSILAKTGKLAVQLGDSRQIPTSAIFGGMTIALTNLRFFAYHGFYAEEQVLGNEFFVDIRVETTQNAETDDLSSTLNYEELYHIVSQHMRIPVRLIETVAQDILNTVTDSYPDVYKAEVLIRKPLPLIGEGVTAEISLSFDR